MVKNEKEFYKAFFYLPVNPNGKISTDYTAEALMKNFTGKLLLSPLEGKRSFLLDYKDGRVSDAYKKNQLAAKKRQSVGAGVSYWDYECHNELRFCTYFADCYGPTIAYSPNCIPPDVCSGQWTVTDFSIDEVCYNVWYNDPPTEPTNPIDYSGYGGDGGTIESLPTIEVKQDSLEKHYPCMVKEVLNKLMQNNAYSKLIQPFQSIQLPNGVTINIPGLPNLTFDFSSQSYGGSSNEYKLGQTQQGYITAMSSKIEFNSSAIKNASQLFLQMAAIHESAHAYSTYYIKAGSYGFPIDTTHYSTWAMNIVNFEVAAKSQYANGNYTDHSLFLENYIDKFVNILKEVNGNNYTDKQYQMAAIYGLNNAGSPPANSIFNGINIYKGILEKSYNNLLTKFGITAAERDAFYLDNLVNVPTNKKLPTNCP